MTFWATLQAVGFLIAAAAAFALVSGGLVFWLSWLTDVWPDGRDRFRRW